MPRLSFQIAVVLLILGSFAFAQRPDGMLRVFFPETAGDAILIQTPAGQHILIDGGADPVALSSALGQMLPFWKRQLDAVILTLPDGKHAPGQVAALARYTPRVAFAPASKSNSATMREWSRLLAETRTPVRALRDGMRFRLDGVEFEVLDAGQGDGGAVLAIRWGGTSVVLAHGASKATETKLAATSWARRVDLLVYPWERDPNNAFVEKVAPRAIVFTDGVSENRPAELTMAQRAVGGAALYHERLHGTIEWRSDGRRATVQVARNYCASSFTWSEQLFASFRKVSASCSNRARS